VGVGLRLGVGGGGDQPITANRPTHKARRSPGGVTPPLTEVHLVLHRHHDRHDVLAGVARDGQDDLTSKTEEGKRSVLLSVGKKAANRL
jgi:hypothetical protein